jgi:alanine racemase
LHDPFLAEQLQRFQRLLAQFQEHGRTFATIHAANTGAVWQAPQAVFTMVRPGLSLYGYAQPADAEVHLRPVMSITSRVLSVRRLWPGETVSYGRRYMTPVETSICTVPIGYGDGYLRSLTGKAHCLIGGNRHPVVGTVCMDELMVDVGNHDVRVGDEVVLLGMQPSTTGYLQSIDAAELASWAGTIAYEITTAISARVPRVFVDGRGL